jgi:3-isopropylmalate/(R)-2-methylmalate dehydratase small subunit
MIWSVSMFGTPIGAAGASIRACRQARRCPPISDEAVMEPFDASAPKPEFVLNRDAYRNARILVADRNFGCGSSREHAVWALCDYGIQAVLAPSFGDIFFNNSFQNGLLPVILPAERVAALRAMLEQSPGSHIAVELEGQTTTGPDGVVDRFEIDPFRKDRLLAGTDDISFTLGQSERIAAFENAYEAKVRWL